MSHRSSFLSDRLLFGKDETHVQFKLSEIESSLDKNEKRHKLAPSLLLRIWLHSNAAIRTERTRRSFSSFFRFEGNEFKKRN